MKLYAWFAVYALLMLEALGVALALVPLTIRLARRWDVLAYPGGRHAHGEPTPILGGLAISGAFVGVIFFNLALAHLFHPLVARYLPEVGEYLVNIPSCLGRLAAILTGAAGVVVLGVLDDRRPLGPWLKLGVMILLTVPLLLAGIRIQGFLPWPWLGALATVFWIVLLMNSFNFMDNMDGLCAGVALIVTLAFGMVGLFSGKWFMTALYAVLAGGLLGFLRYNLPPARLFMGDNGSLFIGYLIGCLSVLSTYYEPGVPTHWPVLTPVLVLGLPLFDTVSVLWIRFRSGKPLMQGDRNHFSHRLLDLGMSRGQALTFIYITTAVVALGAVPLRTVGRAGALALLAQTVLIFWILYRIERTASRKSN